MKRISFLLVFVCSAMIAFSQKTGSVSGTVLDAVTKRPLAGASITVTELKKTVLSDTTGRYRFSNIPVSTYSISVTYVGYTSDTKYNISVTSGNEHELSFELQPAFTTGTEVVLRSSRRTARAATLETPLSVQRLTAEEIRSNPGGNFDISRVVNALPGIGGSSGSVGGYRNDIIIRGGGPGENVFYIDGMEIPVINHFATQGSGGGPTGILNSSFIEDVKVSTSAFDAKYDNVLSGIFDFKQKTGNAQKSQGNLRLSATEFAATMEGPLNKNKDLTYLASVRRSYLQLLFSAIDLPIRPDFWDFQYKLTWKPNAKNTYSFLGVGAIDGFKFGEIKTLTQDKIYTLNVVPSNTQKSYAVGGTWRHTLNNGYLQLALSRNMLDNTLLKYDNNDDSDPAYLRLNSNGRETENKLRLEVNQNKNGWKVSYGASLQALQYSAFSNIRVRAAVGAQPEIRYQFSGKIDFARYGVFAQAGKKFFNDRLGLNFGLRTDMNSFTSNGNDPTKAFSPRLALSYVLADKWTFNASIGRYAKLPPYTILGFRNNSGVLVNKNNNYITNMHYVAGFEYLRSNTTRFTLEGFYKKYDHVPVTVKDGISINNLGADFGSVGNEATTPSGRGESWGFEFFAQQKLTKRFFGIFSYTYFNSRFTNAGGKWAPSAWDNRNLISTTFGYKFKKNWELGLKYRFQGGVPYTPFDRPTSRLNYLTLGQGIYDYSKFNELRLGNFSSSDLRIDKKWNFRKTTFDLFLDVTNWWAAKTVAYPQYTFERNLTPGAFITVDGHPIKTDGSNVIPLILKNDDAVLVPSIGFIIEF